MPIRHLEYIRSYEDDALAFSMVYGESTSREVLIVGGTHGNEPCGVEAIVALHQFFVEHDVLLNGKVRFAIGNPEAYRRFAYATTDEERNSHRFVTRNFNRVFQDVLEEEHEEGRRAIQFRSYFATHHPTLKALLDLHSVSRGDTTIVAYKADHLPSIELARSVGRLPLHFSFAKEHIDGPILEEGTRYGIPGLALECGNHTSPNAKRVALYHALRLLEHTQILEPGTISINAQGELERTRRYEVICKILAGPNFHWHLDRVESEAVVKKGQKYAYDDRNGDHIASERAYLLMPSKIVLPDDVDAGFLCRRV